MSEVFEAAGGCFGLQQMRRFFWLLTICCLNACFLYSGHPLYEATCGPLQSAHVGFRDCLLEHPLCE